MTQSNGTAVPSFNHPELQQAFESFGDCVERYHAKLDDISNDIRALESFLHSKNLRWEIEYRCEPRVRVDAGKYVPELMPKRSALIFYETEERPDHHLRANLPGTAESQALIWAEDEKGKFRLFYECCLAKGTFDPRGEHFFPNMESETVERRPLIETKLETRAAMHKHLYKFLDRVALDLGKSEEFFERFDASDPRDQKAVEVPRGLEVLMKRASGRLESFPVGSEMSNISKSVGHPSSIATQLRESVISLFGGNR